MTLAPHNFARPLPLPGAWPSHLERWFQAGLALLGQALARAVPFAVQTSFERLAVVTASEALAALPDESVGIPVLLAGEALTSLLLVPRPLLIALVGGLLGDAEATTADRALTGVEEALAEHLLQAHWLPAFRDPWPGPAVGWELGRRETMPRCSKRFPSDAPLVALTWALHGPFGRLEGSWLWAKDDLLRLLGHGPAATPSTSSLPVAARLEATVQMLPLELSVQLGAVELRLSQLAQLQAGDVVLLNQRAGDPLRAVLGGKPKFRGRAGRVGAWQAFQIETLIEG